MTVQGYAQRWDGVYDNDNLPQSGLPGLIVIRDEFARVDQVPIGTAADGNVDREWQYITGASGLWGVVAGRAQPTHTPGSTTSFITIVDTGIADGEVSATLAALGASAATTDGTGIIARVPTPLADATNQLRLVASTTLGWRLQQVVGGTLNTLVTTEVACAPGDTIKLRVVGTTAVATINGVEFPYPGVSAGLTGHGFGMRAPRNSSTASAALDSFRFNGLD
ncbi:hypothetical protein [Herbiconiux sp. UC225_62]|uniref:hypothetical protein n=1 Tax=Herbiconiux sp. UC225_62 TaxID=3350168 RepID=UPI0036D416B9